MSTLPGFSAERSLYNARSVYRNFMASTLGVDPFGVRLASDYPSGAGPQIPWPPAFDFVAEARVSPCGGGVFCPGCCPAGQVCCGFVAQDPYTGELSCRGSCCASIIGCCGQSCACPQGQVCDPRTGTCSDSSDGDGSAGDDSDDGMAGDDGDFGDDGGGGCFAAGTLVSTDSNGSISIPIDEIEVGTTVLAYDLEGRKAERHRVTRVYQSESDQVLVLEFGVEQIRCTPRHRFFTGNWTAAKDLQPGDAVLCRDGHWQKLMSVRAENSHQRVFNLRVQNQPNYFVGAAGLLVHNLKTVFGDDGDDGGSTGEPL